MIINGCENDNDTVTVYGVRERYKMYDTVRVSVLQDALGEMECAEVTLNKEGVEELIEKLSILKDGM